jgi:hypothetical protein
MLESGSSGSVRGASSNGRPYREPRSRAVIAERIAIVSKGRIVTVRRTTGTGGIAGVQEPRARLGLSMAVGTLTPSLGTLADRSSGTVRR